MRPSVMHHGTLERNVPPSSAGRQQHSALWRASARRRAASWGHGVALALLLCVGSSFAGLPFLRDERGIPTAAEVVERATPAVVNISVRTRAPGEDNPLYRNPFFRRFFELPDLPPRTQMSAWPPWGLAPDVTPDIATALGFEEGKGSSSPRSSPAALRPRPEYGRVTSFWGSTGGRSRTRLR